MYPIKTQVRYDHASGSCEVRVPADPPREIRCSTRFEAIIVAAREERQLAETLQAQEPPLLSLGSQRIRQFLE